MKTLTVDDYHRIRIPEAKPRTKFVYQNNGNGTITLIQVKIVTKEPFPPGSLKKYVTPAADKEMLAILKGCTQEVVE